MLSFLVRRKPVVRGGSVGLWWFFFGYLEKGCYLCKCHIDRAVLLRIYSQLTVHGKCVEELRLSGAWKL